MRFTNTKKRYKYFSPHKGHSYYYLKVSKKCNTAEQNQCCLPFLVCAICFDQSLFICINHFISKALNVSHTWFISNFLCMWLLKRQLSVCLWLLSPPFSCSLLFLWVCYLWPALHKLFSAIMANTIQSVWSFPFNLISRTISRTRHPPTTPLSLPFSLPLIMSIRITV